LKTTHAPTKTRVFVRVEGRRTAERKRGIAGRRKRGSWWGMRERRMVARRGPGRCGE